MLRALLIYAATLTAFVVGGTVVTGAPLEVVAWLVLLVEVVPIATWAGAMLIRHVTRPPHMEWTRLTCDPVAPPLPAPLPTYRVETPAPKLIEAPGRELTKWMK